MKIYILLAHPDAQTFCGSLADAYQKGAQDAGHEVRRHNIGDLKFDPVLWKGFKTVQELEPDLQQFQENLLWCQKWVIIYPIWWGSMPAILKGLVDRALLPGFAFKSHQNDPFWDRLLTGRQGHIITTSDAPNWFIALKYRNSDLHTMKEATLEYCGIRPVRSTRIGRARYLKPADRQKWLHKITKLASLPRYS